VTVIAGLVDNGSVLIGGDSAGVGGYQLTVRRDSKVFLNGPYVFGFTTSFRMGQLLRWALKPPPPGDPAALEQFMVTDWIDSIRDCLKSGGYAENMGGQEVGGTFLVGVRGRLFEINCDYQVGEPLDGYAAVGCGADVALGALHATQPTDLSADDRVMGALRAAERHSAGVRGPFTLLREGS
jgi:hypothetical protein